jgi:ribosome-associated protein
MLRYNERMEINENLAIPDDELRWSYARSGGPGGQNVNKVSSKAVLRWDLAASGALTGEVKDRLRQQQPGRITTAGELILASDRYRDQERNRQDCLDKLREIIRSALVRPRPRRKTRPSYGSKQERLKVKKLRARVKSGRRRPDAE